MKYNDIDYTALLREVSENNSAFLCGNGLSLNFDSRFSASNLSKSMYSTHRHIMAYYSYDVTSNSSYKKKLTTNFSNTIKILQKIRNEIDFINFWKSALEFAKNIINNNQVIEWLQQNSKLFTLKFGLNNIDLVFAIVRQAELYGVISVNYEYWSVLIYYVLALVNAPSEVFVLNHSNIFIEAVLCGGLNRISDLPASGNGQDIMGDASINGVYIYMRFLFSTNILLNGDAVNVTNLDKWNSIDINNTLFFLSKFNQIMTTNYDLILENLTNKSIYHLHGRFSKEKCRVLSQSFGVTYNLVRYDLSTAIIGDYFLAKSFIQISAELASKQLQNTNIMSSFKIFEKVVRDTSTQVIVIFGLNLDNDYHIIRNIQVNMAMSGIKNAHIIYCYYNDKDKECFLQTYEKCITYSDELNICVNNISVSVIDSKLIIPNIF